MVYSFFSDKKIRLDDFLRKEIPSKLSEPENASNSKIRRLIVSGAVSVNGMKIRRPAFELRGKSEISVLIDEAKFFYEKTPDDIKFEVSEKDVLFEDEYLVIVDKPSRFPTEETIVGSEKRDNLHDALVRYLWRKNPSLRNPPYVGIMHRLDRETSGVILFTKSRSVNKKIQAMFENRSFRKIYVALCENTKEKQNCSSGGHNFSSESGLTSARDFPCGKKFSVEMFMNRVSPKTQRAKWGFVPEEKGGLYSRTDFSVLGEKIFEGKKCFLVQAELFTGRTHQIRVHLSGKGLPVLGDVLYGGSAAERIMLHSFCLEFSHPVTGKLVSVSSEVPF